MGLGYFVQERQLSMLGMSQMSNLRLNPENLKACNPSLQSFSILEVLSWRLAVTVALSDQTSCMPRRMSNSAAARKSHYSDK